MNSDSMPIGSFTCQIQLLIVRPRVVSRDERNGVTYLVSHNYEFGYDTKWQFVDGSELHVKAKLIGELHQQVVIRDALRTPIRVSGYVQGRVQISDVRGDLLFQGRFYDPRVTQTLAGDEALTAIGQRIVHHWENGFGENRYAGHSVWLHVELSGDGSTSLAGQAHGFID